MNTLVDKKNRGVKAPIFSKGFGNKPSNILIVFPRKPKTELRKNMMKAFLRSLKYEIGQDYYFTYAARYSKKKYEESELLDFKKLLKKEFSETNPHLILLMGKFSKKLFFGKIQENLRTNIFYTKTYKGKQRQFFIGSDFKNQKILNNSLDKILLYIKENYG